MVVFPDRCRANLMNIIVYVFCVCLYWIICRYCIFFFLNLNNLIYNLCVAHVSDFIIFLYFLKKKQCKKNANSTNALIKAREQIRGQKWLKGNRLSHIPLLTIKSKRKKTPYQTYTKIQFNSMGINRWACSCFAC